MALLQIALDAISLNKAKLVLSEIKEFIDIVETGTPFLLRYGINAIKEIKKTFPLIPLLADFKIADAGQYESNLAFSSGADIVTVLASAPDSTIKTVIKESILYGKSVMVDIVGIKDIEKRIKEIDKMGADYICAHTGLDEQMIGISTLKNLIKLKKCVKNAKIAVAGGINLSNIGDILNQNPDIVIVGSCITNSPKRREIASTIKRIIEIKRIE